MCSSHLIQLLKHLRRQRQRLLCVTQAADACGRMPATPQQQLDGHCGLVPLSKEHLGVGREGKMFSAGWQLGKVGFSAVVPLVQETGVTMEDCRGRAVHSLSWPTAGALRPRA